MFYLNSWPFRTCSIRTKCCTSTARPVKTVSFTFELIYNHLVLLHIDSFRPQQLEAIRGGRIYHAKSPVNQSSYNIVTTFHVTCSRDLVVSRNSLHPQLNYIYVAEKLFPREGNWDELTFAKTSGVIFFWGRKIRHNKVRPRKSVRELIQHFEANSIINNYSSTPNGL